MRLALTNNNIKKQNHTQEYLGCSYNELILYIEKKFDNQRWFNILTKLFIFTKWIRKIVCI